MKIPAKFKGWSVVQELLDENRRLKKQLAETRAELKVQQHATRVANDAMAASLEDADFWRRSSEERWQKLITAQNERWQWQRTAGQNAALLKRLQVALDRRPRSKEVTMKRRVIDL